VSRDFFDGLFAGVVFGFAAWVWFDAWCERRRNAEAERRAAQCEQDQRAELRRLAASLQEQRARRVRVVHVPEMDEPCRRPR
jgi:hypothetical protein